MASEAMPFHKIGTMVRVIGEPIGSDLASPRPLHPIGMVGKVTGHVLRTEELGPDHMVTFGPASWATFFGDALVAVEEDGATMFSSPPPRRQLQTYEIRHRQLGTLDTREDTDSAGALDLFIGDLEAVEVVARGYTYAIYAEGCAPRVFTTSTPIKSRAQAAAVLAALEYLDPVKGSDDQAWALSNATRRYNGFISNDPMMFPGSGFEYTLLTGPLPHVTLNNEPGEEWPTITYDAD